MRLYIDEVTLRDLLRILVSLPKQLYLLVKEELFWRFVLYPYEISYPVNWQKLREKGLAESFRRMKRHQNAQNQNLRGVEVR